MNDTIMKLLVLLSIACLLGIIGNMDLNDQELEQRQYCEMTRAKFWAQYRMEINCKEIYGENYGR